jgi:deoxyribodipyrimidine photo-lyase
MTTAGRRGAPVIYWFRRDLRLTDLPGLEAAIAAGNRVIPCYVHDEEHCTTGHRGSASGWWLHHSLEGLEQSLQARGSRLLVLAGDPVQTLCRLARDTGATAVHCSRAYDPAGRQLQRSLTAAFENESIELRRFPGELLAEPEQVATGTGQP